jgi:hypothetical protein
MDDARIRELTEEVLGQLGTAAREDVSGLEARVARLEAAVRALQAAGAAPSAPVTVATAIAAAHPPVAHPALRLLDVPHGGERCVLEPDKPCEKSGACRALGY